MTETIYCEVDGTPGTRYEDPYYPGEGYTTDMCATCIRRQRRQAAIDARQAEFADMDTAQAEVLIGAL